MGYERTKRNVDDDAKVLGLWKDGVAINKVETTEKAFGGRTEFLELCLDMFSLRRSGAHQIPVGEDK